MIGDTGLVWTLSISVKPFRRLSQVLVWLKGGRDPSRMQLVAGEVSFCLGLGNLHAGK